MTGSLEGVAVAEKALGVAKDAAACGEAACGHMDYAGTLVFRLGYDGGAYSGFAEHTHCGGRVATGYRDVFAPRG